MPRDKLLVQGLRLFGRHGVLPAENALGQLFKVDVEMQADISRACRTDNFKDTVDYVKVFNIAKRVVAGEQRQLVEKVAQEIADNVFIECDAVDAIRVKVMKPNVALDGVLEGVGVEIWRERDNS